MNSFNFYSLVGVEASEEIEASEDIEASEASAKTKEVNSNDILQLIDKINRIDINKSSETIIVDTMEDAPVVQEATSQIFYNMASMQYSDFYENNNILHKRVRDSIKEGIYDASLVQRLVLSVPITTTITLGGSLSNVLFHEKHLIVEIEPTADIVNLKCNYGTKQYKGYIEAPTMEKSNRGRKKKDKNVKQRKIQGDGSSFNSQITFKMPTNVPTASGAERKPYKYKIFRTGKIQLPGAQPEYLEDIIAKTNIIVDYLNLYLNKADEYKRIRIINIMPDMKNYKFFVIMSKNDLINFSALRDILSAQRFIDDGKILSMNCIDNIDLSCLNMYTMNATQLLADLLENAICVHPTIFDIKYTHEETKLSIKFSTPIPGDIKKKTRVNVFMRGKINILGALEEAPTKLIYGFLLDIFERYRQYLIVAPEEDTEFIISDELDNNIAAMDSTKSINWCKRLVARRFIGRKTLLSASKKE